MTDPDSLASFRERWKQELQEDSKDAVQNVQTALEKLELDNKEKDDFAQARLLFLEASEKERSKNVFEAMRLYRRATQLVPEIEFRMYDELMKKQASLDSELQAEDIESVPYVPDPEDEEDLANVDMYVRFLTQIQQSGVLLQKAETNSKTHISDLPIELILIIFRWLVSNDLDMRSLEQCAAVSKGFYICSRHPEIWRMVCLKIWGLNLGSLKSYPSWRQMYFDRNRVHFHGCYISKTSYFRFGENSFQDQFYKPVHNVDYYRYIRFFPDGIVLMLTTPDDPLISLKKLQNRNPKKKEILKGYYRIQDDTLSVILKRTTRNTKTIQITGAKKRTEVVVDVFQQTFQIEMKIASVAKRKFNKLNWQHYSIVQVRNQQEVVTDFDLTGHLYPALIFSRVESYNSESDSMLHIA